MGTVQLSRVCKRRNPPSLIRALTLASRQMVQFQVVSPIKHPPAISLPEVLREQALENGDQECAKQSPALAEVRQAQSMFCRLWVIANEIFLIYRDSTIGARSLAFAFGKYNKILDLVGALPKTMIRQKEAPHWVLIFQ